MSHIPSNAMPHAQAQPEHSQETSSSQSTWSRASETVTGTIKEYPRAAMAAGAVVVAGAVAAAAMPMMRGRGESTSSSGKGKGSSGNGKSKS